MSEAEAPPDISLREQIRAIGAVASFRTGTTVAIVLLSVTVTVLEGIGLGFLFPIIQQAQARGGDVTASDAPAGGPVEAFARAYEFLGLPFTLESVILGVAIVMTARIAMRFLVSWLNVRLSTHYVRALQVEAFDHILRSRLGYFDEHGSDEILNALVTRVYYAESVIDGVVNFIQQGLLVVMYLSVALYLAPVPTIVLGVTFLALVYGLRSFSESAYAIGDRVDRSHEEMQKTLQAGTQGIREAKLFRMTGELFRDFLREVNRYTESTVQLGRNEIAMKNAYNLATILMVFAMIYFSLTYSSLSVGSLGVFIFAIYRLAPRINELNAYIYSLEGSLPHLVRTWEFIDELGEQEMGTQEQAAVPARIDRLEFVNVGFSYNGEPVLREVSFTLEADEFVALVGPSGAGKSTIVSLLVRLYEPDDGRILADGTPISRFDVDEWRSRIAIVPQNPYIFNDTLRYNLTIGARGASDAEIARVCEIAQVTEFLDDLPNGVETALGDNGVRLSGGQRQRIAIARALLMSADLLVLDEGTSDLDSQIEEQIYQSIDSAARDYAVLTIAHRLSTIADADRIYALEDGQIVETGNHRELIEKDETYAALFHAQSNHP